MHQDKLIAGLFSDIAPKVVGSVWGNVAVCQDKELAKGFARA